MNGTKNKEIIEIALEDIIPNRFQPRLTFDVDALNDLARSIKEHGIIQPLVVRRVQNKFEIIAGERRYKAAGMVGMKTVPCIIMDLSDGESAEVAIVENIQRKEMTPLEEAKSFKKLLEKGYLTQEDLAKKMGKSQSSIANKLRLLNLDELVQDAILNNKISERHARSLLRVSNKLDQRNLLNEIIQNRLTVKQTDDFINEKFGNTQPQSDAQQYVEKNNVNDKKVNNISLPEIKIPTYENIEGGNPQLKILNALGNDTSNSDFHYSEENKSVDLPDESTNPALNIFRYGENKMDNEYKSDKQEEKVEQSISNQRLLDPSELDYNNRNTKENNSEQKVVEDKEDKLLNLSSLESASDFYKDSNEVKSVDNYSELNNISNIKDNSKNISQQEVQNGNVEDLLVSESEERENKYLIGIKKEDNLKKENNNLNFIDIEESQPKYKMARDKINKELESMQTDGLKIYKEESDFGSTIQIIIRIEK